MLQLRSHSSWSGVFTSDSGAMIFLLYKLWTALWPAALATGSHLFTLTDCSPLPAEDTWDVALHIPRPELRADPHNNIIQYYITLLCLVVPVCWASKTGSNLTFCVSKLVKLAKFCLGLEKLLPGLVRECDCTCVSTAEDVWLVTTGTCVLCPPPATAAYLLTCTAHNTPPGDNHPP